MPLIRHCQGRAWCPSCYVPAHNVHGRGHTGAACVGIQVQHAWACRCGMRGHQVEVGGKWGVGASVQMGGQREIWGRGGGAEGRGGSRENGTGTTAQMGGRRLVRGSSNGMEGRTAGNSE
eukprot:83259-Chlamydomonas_euryale.AAC.8